jgi:hypothetical protein
MSKNIIGNSQKLANPKMVSESVEIKNISVDVDSYLNRKTTSTTLSKYLKAAGGFNRGLWQPPLVAEMPTGERFLFDGDHRRALWRLAYPNKKTMPAQILKVSDEGEISRLFVNINKTGRTALKPEEVFVHEYYAGAEDAKITASHLIDCNLNVGLGTKEAGSIIGAVKGPRVKIKGFRNLLNSSGLEAAREASTIIQSLWSKDKEISIELLRGLAKVLSRTQFSVAHRKAFIVWLQQSKEYYSTQKALSTQFKQKGGLIGNRDEQCVALGILLHFKAWAQSPAREQANKIPKTSFNRSFGAAIKSLKAEIS